MISIQGHDHRGASVQLIDAASVLLSNRLSAADRSMLATMIQVGEGTSDEFRPQSAWTYIALAGTLAGFIWLSFSIGIPWPVGALAWASVVGLAYWMRFRRSHTQDAADFLAERGVCAACGYDLRGLGRAADGCTVCPECGAAWRVSRSDIQSSNAPG